MNSLGLLILLQSFLGSPNVVALDNGAIRIEVEPELFAIPSGQARGRWNLAALQPPSTRRDHRLRSSAGGRRGLSIRGGIILF